MVPLADHLFSYVIFPFRPVHLGIGRDVFVEDDDREIQAVMHFESAVTLGPPLTALHCGSERGPAALAARHLVLVTIRQREQVGINVEFISATAGHMIFKFF